MKMGLFCIGLKGIADRNTWFDGAGARVISQNARNGGPVWQWGHLNLKRSNPYPPN